MALTLILDAEIYSPLAIQKACYRFSDVMAAVIRKDGTSYVVEIDFLAKDKSEDGMQAVLSQLKNEITDQNLREQIKAETEPVRNLILSYAFSRTGLIANDANTGSLE